MGKQNKTTHTLGTWNLLL